MNGTKGAFWSVVANAGANLMTLTLHTGHFATPVTGLASGLGVRGRWGEGEGGANLIFPCEDKERDGRHKAWLEPILCVRPNNAAMGA